MYYKTLRLFYVGFNNLFFRIVLFSLCSLQLLCAQESRVLNTISEKLASYKEAFHPEKVYLQTDKDYYTNGDTLWFKAYILDGISHTASAKSEVVHVELLDANSKVIEQRKIHISFDGGAGDFVLAKDIAAGSYFLRAYTKYMLNEKEPVFFQKKIPVWREELNFNDLSNNTLREEIRSEVIEKEIPKPIIRFFPEGGHLIAGLKNVLGYKITDGKGAGLALQGKIKDQNGALITMLGSSEFGLGRAQFKVESGVDYFAEIEIAGKIEKYQVLKPVSKGYVLHINNWGDHLQIRVTTNINDGLKGAVLFGHTRGDTFLKQLVENKAKNSYELKLFTADLNDGVASFTLFTSKGEPVCERLVFVENKNNVVNLSLKTDASNYNFREKVNVDLAVVDAMGLPLSGNFSMSVSSQSSLNKSAENINSWLLLNSELGGTIESPNYFFKDDSKYRKNLLDILMLTHGWRRFVWKELPTDNISKPLKFQPEKGVMITGTTFDLKNKKESYKGLVRLSITEPGLYEEEKAVDLQGRFSFGPVFFQDSISAFMKAVNEGKKKKIAIHMGRSSLDVSFNGSLRVQSQQQTILVEEAFVEEVHRKKVNEFEYDSKVIELDEAVGSAKVKTKKELVNEVLNARTMYGQAQKRIILDSIPNSESLRVSDLLERRLAGFSVKGAYPNQRVEFRGGEVLFLLDGVIVAPEFIYDLIGSEILFIDVLKTAGEVALFGVRARSAVIAVYTDRGGNFDFDKNKEPYLSNFKIPGFYKAREFYSPNYPVKEPEFDKPDYRTTLYWNPDIDAESTSLSFFTGDADGIYSIRVEGVTDDGRLVDGYRAIQVGEDKF